MRRTLVALLILSALTIPVATAGAKTSADGDLVRGAGATWWKVTGDTGKLYGLDVEEVVAADAAAPHTLEAALWELDCTTTSKGAPRSCDFRHPVRHRVAVKAFDVDPAFGSARAVLRLGRTTSVVRWTGTGDYGTPWAVEGVDQFGVPPDFFQAGADAIVVEARRAKVHGDLFGLGLAHARSAGGLFDYVVASAEACTGGVFC